MTSLLGYANQFNSAALSATDAARPVSNLSLPRGDVRSSWETNQGVTTASLLLNAGSPTSWRAFLLARTNLTPSAEVRWAVGSAAGVVDEPAAARLLFVEGYTSPSFGTYAFTRNTPGWRRKADLSWSEEPTNSVLVHHDEQGGLLGALFQRSVTNSIRNSRLEGGASGSPGTAPTNCTIATGAGLTSTLTVGTTEDGLPSLDWQISGTTAGATNCLVWLEASQQIAAVVGNNFDFNLWVKQIAGDRSNITTERMGVLEQDSGGGTAPGGGLTWQNITVTDTRLGNNRQSFEGTMVAATAAYARPYFQVWIAAAGPVDVTYRISCPYFCPDWAGCLPVTPITAPAGAPAAYTRGNDGVTWTPGVPLTTDGGFTAFAEIAVLSSTGAVGAASPVRVDEGTGTTDFLALRPLLSGGAQASDWWGRRGGVSVLDTPTLTGKTGLVLNRHVARSHPSLGFKRWIDQGTSWPTNTDVDSIADVMTRLVLTGVNTVHTFCVKDFRVYSRVLTDNQCLQLAKDGTSYDSSEVSGTTDWVSANVEVGYQQSVKIFDSSVVGQYARCDIRDPSNPDLRLRVGLAYAGDAWAPENGVTWGSQFQIDSRENLSTTRGGQEHIDPLFRKRGWLIEFDSLKNSEAWSYKLYLEAASEAGLNVLFVPETSRDLPFAPVYGIFKSSGGLGYSAHEYQLRSWSATITERL